MVSFTTTKIDRFTAVNGYMVQITADFENAPQIDDFLAKHVNGIGTIEVTMKRPTSKRSLNANGYLWVLCDEIARAIQTDKETVYRALIRRVGVFDYVLVKDQAAQRFRRNWEAKGLGWFTEEVVNLGQAKNTRQLLAYYGSSVYTKEEMARVISEAEEEARAIGVSTRKRNEVKEMIEAWQ